MAPADQSAARARLLTRTRNTPEDFVAWYGLGVCHVLDEAFLAARSCFEKAVALCPDYAEAWLALARLCAATGEASAAQKAARRAAALTPGYIPAEDLAGETPPPKQGLFAGMRARLRKSDALLDRARKALAERQPRQAETFARKACGGDVASAPAPVLRLLARALADQDRLEEAACFYTHLARNAGAEAEARAGLAEICERTRDRDGAVHHALAAVQAAETAGDAAHLPGLRAVAVHALRMAADWQALPDLSAKLLDDVRADRGVVNPFVAVLQGWGTPDVVRACRMFARQAGKNSVPLPPAAPRPEGSVLTVGYVSADFHNHATARLMAGLFAAHDRTRVRVIGLATGPDDGSALRARIAQGCDVFDPVAGLDDATLAQRVRAHGVDVLVDLKGCTDGGRPGLFARRPAPVQVAYLGFPGPSGVPEIDYTIADAVLVPDNELALYGEAVVRLPGSYQINDDRRAGPAAPSRAEAGLPEDALVIANFGEVMKITPEVFDIWLGALADHSAAVLWVQDPGPAARARLLARAAAAGVAARLLFAPVVAQEDHLARLACADLFVDTFTCTAHTNASDALWMGVPVLTRLGDAFADRVAASLLTDLGVQADLVAGDGDNYRKMLDGFLADPARLRAVAARIRQAGEAALLFNTAARTAHLEQAFATMVARQRSGQAPAAFDVQG